MRLSINRPLKIALGDLRHNTIGRHSVFVPVGIGYIGAYTLSYFEAGSIDLRLYTDYEGILKDIIEWSPDVIGLSNYCWNAGLSHHVCRVAKEKNPGVLCIHGGPEFPDKDENRREYLAKRPEIDFYIYGEGELAFAGIVGAFVSMGPDICGLKSKPYDGVTFIHSKTRDLIVGLPIQRFKNMDIIPSPYLKGILDKFLTEQYVPSLETNRGCPYKCTFCFVGNEKTKLVGCFSVQRIKDELTYIAERVYKGSNKLLSICDSNFGLYKRDLEISDHIAGLMEKYNWPMAFDVTTGKDHYDRILFIQKHLECRLHVTLSQQSLNPATLKTIQRKNIPLKQYLEIANELKSRGQKPYCALIIPLPEETKETYLKSLRILAEASIDVGTIYTTMLLKGTFLASKECREKYQMKTKYRILPRQFGNYSGEKLFEIEEVCVETNTMPFDDYVDCRGVAFLMALFTHIQLDIVQRHLEELSMSFYKYIYRIWEITKSGDGPLALLYDGFIKETHEELFDSSEAIYEFFYKPENYKMLLNGEMGDNLIRKYLARAFLIDCSTLFEFAYTQLKEFAENKITQEVSEALNVAKRWAIAVRRVNNIFDSNMRFNFDHIEMLSLPYDVLSWYKRNDRHTPLTVYNIPVVYNIFYDKEHILGILNEGKNLYGLHNSEDTVFKLGKIINNWSINDLWRICVPVVDSGNCCPAIHGEVER